MEDPFSYRGVYGSAVIGVVHEEICLSALLSSGLCGRLLYILLRRFQPYLIACTHHGVEWLYALSGVFSQYVYGLLLSHCTGAPLQMVYSDFPAVEEANCDI